jgi:hypothetical protein
MSASNIHTYMKHILIFAFVLLAGAGMIWGQTSDKYQFGDRRITIPAPDGFTNVVGRFAHVTKRMNATESPGNDLLAVHVPETFVPKLQASEEIDLEFYTKASAINRIRAADVSAELYKAVVADLEKNFNTYLDPNGPVMTGVEKNSEKGLAAIGNETKVEMAGTKNLGFFEKTPQVFSAMMQLNLVMYGRRLTTLGTLSAMHIKGRFITVATYKMNPTDRDAKMLADFAKKWTAKIIAANK